MELRWYRMVRAESRPIWLGRLPLSARHVETLLSSTAVNIFRAQTVIIIHGYPKKQHSLYMSAYVSVNARTYMCVCEHLRVILCMCVCFVLICVYVWRFMRKCATVISRMTLRAQITMIILNTHNKPINLNFPRNNIYIYNVDMNKCVRRCAWNIYVSALCSYVNVCECIRVRIYTYVYLNICK
jgi:hypothetical protein